MKSEVPILFSHTELVCMFMTVLDERENSHRVTTVFRSVTPDTELLHVLSTSAKFDTYSCKNAGVFTFQINTALWV
jgi:hypothetical protein